MKVAKLISELERCNQDEDVTMCIGKEDGCTKFYYIDFVSLSGQYNLPVMLNGSYKEMDSNRR